ncbi:hypothetical protein LJR162_004385 [Pseudomonas umsongensis]
MSPFICAHTNRRDNKHGGSLQNRLRLLNDPRACAQMMYRAGGSDFLLPSALRQIRTCLAYRQQLAPQSGRPDQHVRRNGKATRTTPPVVLKRPMPQHLCK